MKIRVFKKLDGSVAYNFPNPDKYPDLSQCPIPEGYENLAYIIGEENDFPKSDSSTGDYHEMIYFDGNVIKQDKAWEVMVMPVFLIKEKHLERLNTKIDLELGHPDPNAAKLIGWQRDKEECQKFTDKEWYQQALDNMAEDGIVKPVIEQKLKDKLK